MLATKGCLLGHLCEDGSNYGLLFLKCFISKLMSLGSLPGLHVAKTCRIFAPKLAPWMSALCALLELPLVGPPIMTLIFQTFYP